MYQFDLRRYEMLYINSLLHFSKTKPFKINGMKVDLNIYLLDKRFLLTRDLDEIQCCFPKCKLKHLDKYWIIIYSSGYLNNNYAYQNLLKSRLIVPVTVFLKIVGLGD